MALLAGMGGAYWGVSVLNPREENVNRLNKPMKFVAMTLFDVQALNLPAGFVPNSARSVPIDRKSLELITKNMSYHRGSRIWKGSILGIVTLENGTQERIALSYYGGFFKILGEPGYYQTEGESQKELERCLREALQRYFIPWRYDKGLDGSEQRENQK